MSILNIHLEKDLAVIAANTEVVAGELGSDVIALRSNVGKVFALPEKGAVVSGRGWSALLCDLLTWAANSSTDFDGLCESMGDAAAAIVRRAFAHAGAAGATAENMAHFLRGELVLVGRSASRQTMICNYLAVSERGEISAHCELASAVIPWVWGDHPATEGSVEWMTNMARRQSKLAHSDQPGMAWRGDLTIATITPESIDLRTVRDFWMEPKS